MNFFLAMLNIRGSSRDQAEIKTNVVLNTRSEVEF